MTISTSRISKLVINEVNSKGSLYLLIIGVTFGLLVFFFFNSGNLLYTALDTLLTSGPSSLPSNLANTTSKFNLIWFPKILLIVCTLLTGLSFSEYQDKNRINFHLSLPATKLEKWLSKVFLSLVLIPLLIVLLYQIFASLTYSWDESQVNLGITDSYLWKHYTQVLLIQCVIFLGAIIFRSYSTLKTLLGLVIFFVTYNIVQCISIMVLREDIDLISTGILPGLTSLSNLLDRGGYEIASESTVRSELIFGFPDSGILVTLAFLSLGLSYLKFIELES